MDVLSNNSFNFVAALALFQHRRDTAIGLTHFTTKQKGLIWYYNLLLSQHLKNAAVYGALQTIQKRMSEIMQEAQTSDLDRQRHGIESLK